MIAVIGILGAVLVAVSAISALVVAGYQRVLRRHGIPDLQWRDLL